MKGRINSIETMGLVDGPGIRFVVFMQGCKLRCLYCHNPETWQLNGGYEITPHELLNQILKYKNYFGSNGGVTFSGGEPLIQAEFLLDILKLCKKNNINVCLDTAGMSGTNNAEILKYVDLVLMDIKALDEENYKYLTSGNVNDQSDFLKLCNKLNKRIWIRQVIIPDFNDNEDYILALRNYLSDYTIEKIEFLPYNTIGVHKYKKLNLPYKLTNIKAMDNQKCEQLYEYYDKIPV